MSVYVRVLLPFSLSRIIACFNDTPTVFFRSVFLLIALPFTSEAGTLTIDCSQGRVFIGYGVNDVETCLGRRDIEINGEKTTEAFTLIDSGNRLIPLNLGDSAHVRARMDCATTENDVFEFEGDDVETVIVEARTVSGCQQSFPNMAPALLPEWNEELNLSNTEANNDVSAATDTETSDLENTPRESAFSICANLSNRILGEDFGSCVVRFLFR